MTPGVCRVCGCTDERPCVIDPDPDDLVDAVDFWEGATMCSWIKPDLCSRCGTPDDEDEEQDDAAAVVFDAHGNPWRSGRSS